jgi:hypothetical protein
MNTRDAVRIYKGEGTLTFTEGDQIRCDFECAQLSDARIVCHCLVKGLENEYFNRAVTAHLDLNEAEQLQGQTDDGAELTAYRLRWGRIPGESNWGTNESYVLLSFLTREMRIHSPSKSNSVSSIRFGLTNLEFLGTEPYVEHSADGTKMGRLQLPLTIAGRQVIIRPLDDYKSRIRTIKATRGIDVTSEALVEFDSPGVKTEIIDLLDDLCLLLSLAKGCQVQWIYYDLCSDNGRALETYHRNTVTKPYTPLTLIGALPSEDMKHFVEQTFDRFRERKETWDLRRTIAAYVDARLEQDFLESRGLKMAILMDFLETHYLARLGKETVLNEDIFGNKLETLRERVLEVLGEVFDEATNRQLDLMAKHVQGLKYYPLRQGLREIFDEFGLKVSSHELQRFMANRNKLVHYGRFRSENYWQEYTSMMVFVDKVLLAILAYDGYYYDWTKPPGWVGRNMEMRVKLELEPFNGDEP